MGKAELEASLSTLDVWLIIFGVFVAIGVVGESITGFLHWRRSGQLQAAQTFENLVLEKEIAGLRAREPLVIDALKSTVEVTRTLGLTSSFLMALSQELTKVANPGMVMPGAFSAEQHAKIVSSINGFAGTKFDVEMNLGENDVERLMLTGSLVSALEEAGWIKMSGPQKSRVDTQGVAIDVVARNGSKILDAATTLASVLNAEGSLLTA